MGRHLFRCLPLRRKALARLLRSRVWVAQRLHQCRARPERERYDAVYSANTAHIMSAATVEKMFAYVGATLEDGGLFLLYGPFRLHGEFTTSSNAAFDEASSA